MFSFLIADGMRMVGAFLTAFLLTLFLGKPTIFILQKLNVRENVEREYCETLKNLHNKKNRTPTMGGILMTFVLLVSLVCWGKWNGMVNYILFASVAGGALLGFYDDFLKLREKNKKGVSPKRKLIGQVSLAIIIGIGCLWSSSSESRMDSDISGVVTSLCESDTYLYVPFHKKPLHFYGCFALGLAFLLILFVLVGTSNAVNLTDGLDGLAMGNAVIVLICFFVVAWLTGNRHFAEKFDWIYIPEASEIAVFLTACVGTGLAFLIYNRYPARMFMGDTGSLMWGNVMGVVAVLLRRELLLAVVGGVFVIEALSVILQVYSCKLRGRRIFLCSPLHHHFEYLGWSEKKVVFYFRVLGAVLAVLGLISIF